MRNRPNNCYRKMDRPPNTRKKFIRRYPDLPEGLRKFSYGNTAKFDFPAKVELVAVKNIQVSAKALEAVRIMINRELRLLGEKNYRFQIKSIPHHITRMHGLVGVVKSERMIKGMRQSFGRSQKRFARVKKGTTLIEVLINDEPISYRLCKKVLTTATKKLPSKWKIVNKGISPKNLTAVVRLPKRPKEKTTSQSIVIRDL